MIDHLEDGCFPKTNVLLFEGGYGVVSDGVQDEFLSGLFNAEVVLVTLLLDLVLGDELLPRCGGVASGEGICRVCAWVSRC